MNFISTLVASISFVSLVSASNPHKDADKPKTDKKTNDMIDFVSNLNFYCNYVSSPEENASLFETGEINQFNEPSLYYLIQEVRHLQGKSAFVSKPQRQILNDQEVSDFEKSEEKK